jgi:stress response protein SCP2
MPTVSGPPKNSVNELKVSQDGARRFMVNLSWTPREDAKPEALATKDEKPGSFFKKLLSFGSKGGSDAKTGRDADADRLDLDLDCYVFNEDMLCKCVIGTGGDALMIEGSKKVYHSGDDQSGTSGEQVYVETEGLPDDYRHFFFVVRSDCKYSLDQFRNPLIKLVDAKTGEVALENTLIPQGELDIPRAYNYAFCHIYRTGDKWMYRNIDIHMGDGVEWDMTLPDLVRRQAA